MLIRSPFLLVLPCLSLMSSLSVAKQSVPSSASPVTLDGIIDQENDDTLAFTPDGKTVFFDRSEDKRKTIMMSHKLNGRWSAPEIAGFSGKWFDQDPVVAPDGSYLLFNSDRPVKAGTEALLQNYFAGGPGPGSNIWRVDRKGDGSGEPVWLSPIVNSDVFIDFASIASDGTLYFMRWDPSQKAMHLWRSRYERGSYLAPEFVTLGVLQNRFTILRWLRTSLSSCSILAKSKAG
jgi:WD40-like Beta Propeller Repeat